MLFTCSKSRGTDSDTPWPFMRQVGYFSPATLTHTLTVDSEAGEERIDLSLGLPVSGHVVFEQPESQFNVVLLQPISIHTYSFPHISMNMLIDIHNIAHPNIG